PPRVGKTCFQTGTASNFNSYTNISRYVPPPPPVIPTRRYQQNPHPQQYRPFQHNKGRFVRRTYAEVLARKEQPQPLMDGNPYDILYEEPAPESEYYEEYQQTQKVRPRNNRPQEQRRQQQPIAADDYFQANTIIEADDFSPTDGQHEQPPKEIPIGQTQASPVLRPIHIILSSSMASRIWTSQLYNRNNHVRIKSISGYTIYKYQVEISSGQYKYLLYDAASLAFVVGTNDIAWDDANIVIDRIKTLIETTKRLYPNIKRISFVKIQYRTKTTSFYNHSVTTMNKEIELLNQKMERRFTPELSRSSTNGAYISPIFRETCPGTPKTKTD
ncbi:unnamed protein product, partial [Didymodactylos carnosus]